MFLNNIGQIGLYDTLFLGFRLDGADSVSITQTEQR